LAGTLPHVTFASSNQNKYHEVQSILSSDGIAVDYVQAELTEIQSDSLEKIAKEKAKSALVKLGKPVIVEDDGLFINLLKGFPGQYSSYVYKTIGNAGILKLLNHSANRSAYFRSLIVFYDGQKMSISEGRAEGRISYKITNGGWGYDPIFIPSGTDLTFAQLNDKKGQYSHRKKALETFARWYLNMISNTTI
jgi:XTP/dITP diphosphohydrolase